MTGKSNRTKGPDQAPVGELPGAAEPSDVAHVDIDSSTGESVGSGLEPQGAAPADPPQAPKPEDKRKASLSEIYGNYSRNRDDEIAAAREAEPDEMRELDRQAGASIEEEEEVEVEKEADPPGQEAAEKEPGTGKSPTFTETYTLNVYGEERQASHDQVIEAGIAALQKQVSADVLLERARSFDSRVQQEAAERSAQLLAWQENLQKGLDRTGKPIRSPQGAADSGSGTAGLPDGVTASRPEISTLVEEALSRAYDAGDTKGAADILVGILTEGRGQSATPNTVEEVAAAVEERLRAQQEKRDREASERQEREAAEQRDRERRAANEIFREEFPELFKDDVLFAATKLRLGKLMATPEHKGKALPEMVRIAAREINKERSGENQSVDETLTARRKLKARTPAAPVTTQSARHEAPKPEQPDYSASGYVQRLKASRRPDQAAG